MKKNFILSSILLGGMVLNSGCAKKVTPIIPTLSQPQTSTSTQTSVVLPQHQPVITISAPYHREITPVQYEHPVEITNESAPQTENSYETIETQPIENNYTPQQNEVTEASFQESYSTQPTEAIIEQPPVATYTPPAFTPPPAPPAPVAPPTPISNGSNGYQLKTIQGESITINEGSTSINFPQYQGKIVLFEIFGKNCEYCFKEMPIISRIREKYGSRLQMITIQGDDRMSPSTASRLIAKYNMNYPIIERDDAKGLLSYIGNTFGWTGTLPFIQIIKDGATEATFNEGGASFEELCSAIDGI